MIVRHLLRGPGRAVQRDCLYAIYDLNFFPVSFDFCWFLAAAELERQRRGLRSLCVVFIALARPYKHPMPPDHEDHVDEAAMLWRFSNVVLPLTNLLRSCSGAMVMPAKNEASALLRNASHVWPSGWANSPPAVALTDIYRRVVSELTDRSIALPLQATPQGMRYVGDWANSTCPGARIVTITLRQHRGGAAVRNSNLPNWRALASKLTTEGFRPVFVPDTESAFHASNELKAFTIFAEGPWNIELRMALYESAYVNLFVNNGPASLCVLNQSCRYLMFKVTSPSLRLTSPEYLAELGFTEGRSPGFAGPFQRWIWEQDSLAVLEREFRDISQAIDSA